MTTTGQWTERRLAPLLVRVARPHIPERAGLRARHSDRSVVDRLQELGPIARSQGVLVNADPIQKQSSIGNVRALPPRTRAPSGQEKEIVELMTKIAALAIEHERDRGQRQLLIDELTHRVKNLLAVILSISGSTLRGRSEPAAYKAFEDRLVALSKAQNLLTQSGWSNVNLHELVTGAVSPFVTDQQRLAVEGPAANIPARLTLPFALALHELCTNASKYGALATDKGRISIDWIYTAGNVDPKLLFRWSEAGGPSVSSPFQPRGFGSRLIKTVFASDGCSVNVDYRPEGLVCEITLPVL